MKIVVIGGTRYIQLATVERLRQQGHDVAAALPQCRALTTTACREPGLRGFLKNAGSILRHLWHGRHFRLGLLRQGLGGHGVRGRARGGCQDSMA
jgi:NAD(P)-dependent dehydrogenase (short-subunit alcohol dehydrogenase family)